jgi:putative nucleotidyltransferase with HDIG domain
MKRILFVDDEPKVLEGLQRMLHLYRSEWEMTFVPGGAEAVEALAAQTFDVIVSDVRMPGMDGIQLLDHVQKNFPGMIRVVLSGYFEREVTLRAARIAHQYLAKPCEPAKLHETISDLCRSNAILTNEAARGVVSAIGSLPSPPQTYSSLKHALQRPEVCLSEAGRIIEQDVGMTAKILQLVNSPLFGIVSEISSVHLALEYVGLAALRELVLSVEIFQTLEMEQCVEGFSLNAFQSHCRLAAKIAARLAPAAMAEVAAVAALLHDAGKLVLAARLPEPFQLSLKKSLEEDRPLYEVEEEVIGSTHAEIGAYLLSLWGLPKPIVDALRSHHRPSAIRHASTGLDVPGITHIADALIADVACGVPNDAPPARRWDLKYLDGLGVTGQIPGWRGIAREIASRAEPE